MKKLTFTKKFSVKPTLTFTRKPMVKIPLSSIASRSVKGKKYS